MKTSKPPKAIDGADVETSEELRIQIASALEAIDQDLWMFDYHISEGELNEALEKNFQEDKLFLTAQLYWLKGLLKVAHIELANSQRNKTKNKKT